MHLQASSGIFIVEDNLLYQQLIARELEDFGGTTFFLHNRRTLSR